MPSEISMSNQLITNLKKELRTMERRLVGVKSVQDDQAAVRPLMKLIVTSASNIQSDVQNLAEALGTSPPASSRSGNGVTTTTGP